MKFLLAVLLTPTVQDESIRDLVRGWGFEDPAVRQAATDIILKRWRSWTDEDLAVLAAEAKSKDPEVAAQAQFVVRRIGIRRTLGGAVLKSLPGIDAILDGGNEERRLTALKQLVALWKEGTLTDADVHRAARVARSGSWERLPLDAVVFCRDEKARPLGPLIASFLKHPDRDVRSNAADTIGFLKMKGYAAELVSMLQDEEEELCIEAGAALCMLGAKDQAPRIVPLLRHQSPGVRGNAAVTLADLGAKETVPEIARLLEDPQRSVRLEAVWALGVLEAGEFAPEAAGYLSDEKPWARRVSVEALGRMKAKSYAPQVARRVGDSDRLVRLGAVTALAEMGDEGHRHLLEAARREGSLFTEAQELVDELTRVRDPDLHERLKRRVTAEHHVRTWKQLQALVATAGFKLVLKKDGELTFSILKGTEVSVRKAVQRNYLRLEIVVADGDRILFLSPDAALDHWQKKLDGK